MTSKQFLQGIVAYYGNYPRPGIAQEMLIYVRDIPETEFYGLLAYLKLTVSTQYSFVPDVACIETARKDIWKDKPATLHQITAPDPDSLEMSFEEGEIMKMLVDRLKMPKGKLPADGFFKTCSRGHDYYGEVCVKCVEEGSIKKPAEPENVEF